MSPEIWLITGGAGYIGAHIADEFLTNGKNVVIYDSLVGGLESRISFLRKKHKKDIPLVVADICDIDTFMKALDQYKPTGVIHSAALKAVGESMIKPDLYFEVNFHATAKLLEAVNDFEIKKFIFSSTAAIYGSPDHSSPVKEDDPKSPISPYGASKLAAENIVNQYLMTPGNFGTSLRFFNVVGTSAPELTDDSMENLLPIVIDKLKTGQRPIIYGTDYPTPDGTCVRDYVDVRDVARAHLLTAEIQVSLPLAMNIGTGRGASVREVIELTIKTSGRHDVTAIETNRRAGDPAYLCADVSMSKSRLKFTCMHNLQESIESILSR
jgi:UDP-glucose 4-epimerase